jgi:poly(A) polymerase
MLVETHLAAVILPEVVPADAPGQGRLEATLAVLDRLPQPSFPLALAALVHDWVDPAGAGAICRRWRLSNEQAGRVAWLVAHRGVLPKARSMRWSKLQKVLVAEGIGELLDFEEAVARARLEETAAVDWCRLALQQPREVLDPPPLVTGDDLIGHGVPRGPKYRVLLERIRDAQLDGEIHTRRQALELADRILEQDMDKRLRKKIEALHQRIQRLRQQLAGARKQRDESGEAAALERQLAEAEAELQKVKDAAE